MRAQTILFLLVDRVREKLDCRPYRGGGEGNPKRLEEAASLAFSNRSIFLTIRDGTDRRAPCETGAWQHRRRETPTAGSRWWLPWSRWPDTNSTSDPSHGRRFRPLAKTCLSA